MARPIKRRRICQLPSTAEFSPCGRRDGRPAVELAVEEYETLRLIDLLGYTQEQCAEQMDVSRATVQAIYNAARRKLADVVVHGRRLVIQGGHYGVCERAGGGCPDCACRGCGPLSEDEETGEAEKNKEKK